MHVYASTPEGRRLLGPVSRLACPQVSSPVVAEPGPRAQTGLCLCLDSCLHCLSTPWPEGRVKACPILSFPEPK